MFTGIVETKGVICKLEGGRLRISTPWLPDQLHLGQSMAVDGCCLTITRIHGNEVEFDLSPETVGKTTFLEKKSEDLVNLERGLKLGETLDGHLVTGHIDTIGAIRKIDILDSSGSKNIWVDIPSQYLCWLIQKGSVALDGVSLTVNDVDLSGFSCVLIPHTLKISSLGLKKERDHVNLEFDLIAKYAGRLLPNSQQVKKELLV